MAFDRAKSISIRGSIGDYHSFRKFEIYIFAADAFSYDNRRYLEDRFSLWIVIRQTFWEGISVSLMIVIYTNMNSSSHCRTSIFQGKIKISVYKGRS